MKEAGSQITLNYEDCHNLYSLPNVITMMKSGKMKREGHRSCMTAWTWHTVWSENLKDTDQFEGMCVNGIKFKLILNIEWDSVDWVIWSLTGIKGGLL